MLSVVSINLEGDRAQYNDLYTSAMFKYLPFSLSHLCQIENHNFLMNSLRLDLRLLLNGLSSQG